ncbi:MAG: hypothetical protein ABW252_00550 [Polyangiales bacterium]
MRSRRATLRWTLLTASLLLACSDAGSDEARAGARDDADPSDVAAPSLQSQEVDADDTPLGVGSVDAARSTPPRDASVPAAPTAPAPTATPVDGDPSKPLVSIPGVPCGPASGRGSAHPTVKIGGRDVVVVYPCAREGASVTFLFTLHGTLQEAQKVPFTMNAGPFHRLADSHNVIYVLPKAIGTQWGNGDDGRDLPHIHEVIDWVYATFGSKWNIRSMWAQGGSWGAAYLSRTLACDPKLESRLKGVRLIVGGGCPRCSNRLSCIVAQQELEVGGGSALSPQQREERADRSAIPQYASSKGCSAKVGPEKVGNSQHWRWPGCNPGWVYSYYLGPGQHADPWDLPTITKTMDEMKSIER